MRETPSFEQLYLQERKKTMVIAWVAGITAVVLLIVVVLFIQKGSGVKLAPSATNSTSNTTPQTPGSGSSSGGGIKVADNVLQGFLNADGSVNQGKIDQILGQVPPDYKDQMLDRFDGMIGQATTKGEITSTQASELRQAFGLQ
jgi:hypothetical protein